MGKTLTEHLQKLKDQKRGIFVPYIMAGDHEKGLAGLQETIQFSKSLVLGQKWRLFGKNAR